MHGSFERDVSAHLDDGKIENHKEQSESFSRLLVRRSRILYFEYKIVFRIPSTATTRRCLMSIVLTTSLVRGNLSYDDMIVWWNQRMIVDLFSSDRISLKLYTKVFPLSGKKKNGEIRTATHILTRESMSNIFQGETTWRTQTNRICYRRLTVTFSW